MTDAEGRIVMALTTYTQRSSAQLAQITDLRADYLYPALARLERLGVIASEWEDMPKPRRRRYWLTGKEQSA